MLTAWVSHQNVLEHLIFKCELFHVAQESVREIYPLAAVRHHRKSALKEPGSLEEPFFETSLLNLSNAVQNPFVLSHQSVTKRFHGVCFRGARSSV